ncbi:MAG: hypothetical protein JNL75_01570 [Chitinophagales bacterium]|nr:hypothetical protein [Chitinophagales bacterium]
MNKLFGLLFILGLSHTLFGQKNDFSGSIMYSDKKNLPCELYLHIDSSYQVSGNLSREVNGNMVNHLISGDFEPKEKTIYLREYARNKSDCAIFFQGKVYHLLENIYTIAGIFKSLDSLNCPSGHINVICRDFNFNLYPKEEKKPILLSEKDEETILANLLSQKIKKEANFIQVRENDKVEINAGADTLYLKIYDNQKVDGDRVKIVFNETVVIDNYMLTDEQAVFKLLPQKGKNILKILAINEGKIALNTSKVELYNRLIHEYYINVLYKNQHTQYEINN